MFEFSGAILPFLRLEVFLLNGLEVYVGFIKVFFEAFCEIYCIKALTI
jgi:hypothetical protein